MDNRVFNVNGSGKAMLTEVLRLALWQHGGCRDSGRDRKADGYRMSNEDGLVLLWHVQPSKGDQKFITPLGAEALAEMVHEWLKTDEARSIPHADWDVDCQHDGDNSEGWRVYCDRWGHVGGNSYAIVAIKHAYMWHGK